MAQKKYRTATLVGHLEINGHQFHGREHLLRNQDNVIANIAFCHGYAEHSGRYEHVFEYLNQQGYNVYSFDMRNHGRTGGEPGLIEDIDELVEDYLTFASSVQRKQPDKPLIARGHSTGAAIVASALTKLKQEENKGEKRDLDFAASVLTGAAIMIPPPPMLNKWWIPTPVKTALNFLLTTVFAPIISKIAPRLGIDDAAPIEALTTNPQKQIEAKHDDLMYKGKVKARTGYEIIKNGKFIQKHAGLIDTPMLLMHGDSDTVCDPNGSIDLYNQISSKEKQLEILTPNILHEIHNELYSESIDATPGEKPLQKEAAWLDKVLQKKLKNSENLNDDIQHKLNPGFNPHLAHSLSTTSNHGEVKDSPNSSNLRMRNV